jgi:methyl-accepting chemotaxis protein
MRLISGFTAIFFIFSISGAILGYFSIQSKNSINKVSDEVLVHTMNFIEIKQDIIQIQQWLTDIAATRAAKGYDDGFDQAEKYYNDAKKRISFTIADHKKLGEKELVDVLEQLHKSLENYYVMGKKMANAYIESGPEKGNPMMENLIPMQKNYPE